MMNTDITIALSDLVIFLLYALGIAAVILLILVLIKLFMLLKRLNSVVSDNKENIDQLMTILPSTVESINEGVESVRTTVDNAGETIEYIGDSFTGTAHSSGGTAEGILEVVRVASEVAKAVIHYIAREER